MNRKRLITALAVLTAVIIFISFELLELEEIKLISFALSLYHFKHFAGICIKLAHKIAL